MLAAASAPLLAWAYGRPELVPIVLSLAGIFVLSGANTQYRADLSRGLRFKALAFTDIAGQALGIAAAITAALLGAGYWAIVIQQITMSVVSLLINALLCRWLPGRPRRDVPMRNFITFGSHLLGSNLLGFAVNNLDNVGVGLVWGPGATRPLQPGLPAAATAPATDHRADEPGRAAGAVARPRRCRGRTSASSGSSSWRSATPSGWGSRSWRALPCR